MVWPRMEMLFDFLVKYSECGTSNILHNYLAPGRTMSAHTETVGVVCHHEVGFSCQLLSGAQCGLLSRAEFKLCK